LGDVKRRHNVSPFLLFDLTVRKASLFRVGGWIAQVSLLFANKGGLTLKNQLTAPF
jgi:hypothetical protein